MPTKTKENMEKPMQNSELHISKAAISHQQGLPACNDTHCPYHGKNIPRGRTFEGKVIKADTHKSVTMEFKWLYYIPKYERYQKKRTRIKAHNPPCINAKIGDKVKIAECRPISKTKKFVIVSKKL